MSFIRGSRDRRIDRALSSVLDNINEEREERLRACETWHAINLLDIEMNDKRKDAYIRADCLCSQWHARVLAMEGDE